MKATYKQQDISGKYRFLDVFARHKGAGRLLRPSSLRWFGSNSRDRSTQGQLHCAIGGHTTLDHDVIQAAARLTPEQC